MIIQRILRLDIISFRTWFQKGFINLKYVPIEEQVIDVLIKPLAHVKFEYFRDKLGVVQKDLSQKRE